MNTVNTGGKEQDWSEQLQNRVKELVKDLNRCRKLNDERAKVIKRQIAIIRGVKRHVDPYWLTKEGLAFDEKMRKKNEQ